MSFKLTYRTHAICIFISLLIGLLMQELINELTKECFINNYFVCPTNSIFLNFLLNIILLMAIMSLIHELIHGIAFRILGYKVKYGFKIIYAFTKETTGKPIPRIQFLIVLLSPVTLISILSLFINHILWQMIYILNLLGSTGDILMAFALCKYDYNSCIIDRDYGFDVISNL